MPPWLLNLYLLFLMIYNLFIFKTYIYKYINFSTTMFSTIAYVIISVILVSLVSLISVTYLAFKKDVHKYLLFLVSLSAGTLFGGAFLHLLPEAVETPGFTVEISFLLIAGVLTFFILEKFIHWRHCHHHAHHEHKYHPRKHPTHLAPLNLIGDAVHNFLDGLVIAGSYLVSVPAGIATTIAVIFHEIPQEIADFGVLLYAGMKKWKALFFNFLSATMAIVGAIVGLILGTQSEMFIPIILPFAAGGFLYIAGSNLIPELHKECGLRDSFWHFTAMILGIAIMAILRFI